MEGKSIGLTDRIVAFLCLIFWTGLSGSVLVRAQNRVVVSGEPIRFSAPNAAYSMQPRWSPNGDVIAFTGSNYEGLSVASVSGRLVKRLTDLETAGFGFSWSHDGTAVLTRVTRLESGRTVHAVLLLDVATSEARAMTGYRSRMNVLPEWMDDDVHVILPGTRSVEMLDTGRPIRAGKKTPDSPLIVASGDRLSKVDVDSGEITSVGEREIGTILNLVRSPDGSRVAFEVMGGDLIVTNVDGSHRTSLGQGHRPRWSPDGKWIVYMVTEDDGHQFTSADLVAATEDGSTRVRLTNTLNSMEMNPDWSPDGRFIAYDDRGVIYLLPVRR